ncbi:MAG TPA: nuclear transport factor 2 family protein [Chitinophagaceae bacterium]|nr:nuclear transport factor 2 family protein [Chitinophagaceae bacterium]
MKLTLILAALLIPALSFSQLTEQDKVNNTIKAMFQGLAELSIEQIRNASTHDIVILEHGEIWNMDTIVTRLNALRLLNPVRVNSFEFMQTEIRDQTAWVTYRNKADVTMNGKKSEYNWLESAVLVKKDDGWRVKMLHSTRVPPARH